MVICAKITPNHVQVFKEIVREKEESTGGLRKLSPEEVFDLESSLAENGLPFDSYEEAEAYYFGIRDADLAQLKELNQKYPALNLDFKAKSLARIEGFYFENLVDQQNDIGITKEKMEELITTYMRQVFVNLQMAEWFPSENDYALGKYEFGIMYGYGSWTDEHYAENLDKEGSKTRTYLYDKFMMYVPAEREQEVQ